MTQEQKNLLIKDLCSRFPYGVKCKDVTIDFIGTMMDISRHDNMCKLYDDCGDNYTCFMANCKPYLFPLSSMTEEQKKAAPFESSLLNALINGHISLFEDEELTIDDLNRLFDWFNKKHFDYRGLIEKGLAIDATGLNVY